MADSLLGFSGIELFGHRIAELDIVDGHDEIWVDIATTENLEDLKEHPDVDGVSLKANKLILVKDQEDKTENGVYRVKAGTEKWDRKDFVSANNEKARTRLKDEDLVRVRKGTTNGGKRFRASIKPTTVAKCTVAFDLGTATDGELTSLKLGKENLIESSVQRSNLINTNRLFADAVAIAVNQQRKSNDKSNGEAKFKATANEGDVTIPVPKRGWQGNGLKITETHSGTLGVTDSGDTVGGATESEFRLEKKWRGGAKGRGGANQQLENQLSADNARFARIYGFSYENVYYDLPYAVVFLVHGKGHLVTQENQGAGNPNPSSAPRAASLTGLAAPAFDFADDLRVWSYDKADYTIRMDVDTGMFEQVLLDALASGGGDASAMSARGMNARGMNARGMNARGMNARGMNARGMNARGGNSD